MPAQDNPCRDFFEQHAQTSDKAGALQQSGTAVKWEALSASCHSPGPVTDEEALLRLVISPIHLDVVNKTIRPSLLSDVKDKGGSVHRLKHITREAAIGAGQAWQDQKNATGATQRTVHGTVTLPADDVRRLKVGTGHRAFCVFDTAKPDDPSHADIFLVATCGEKELRSARLQLYHLATAAFQPV